VLEDNFYTPFVSLHYYSLFSLNNQQNQSRFYNYKKQDVQGFLPQEKLFNNNHLPPQKQKSHSDLILQRFKSGLCFFSLLGIFLVQGVSNQFSLIYKKEK